jgi:thiol:disulfide interchange protein DsbA
MIQEFLRRALASALLAVCCVLPACAKEPATQSAAPATQRAAAPAAAPAATWSVGTNYNVLARPQPVDAPAGKVAVVEFFWYGCPHCAALDPLLETWKTKKPEYIEFSRTHVVWGPLHAEHAKLYYVLQALGRMDLHPKVFEAIHRENNLLAAPDETQARALQQAFLEKNGVSKKDFNAAYDSMSVRTNVQRALEETQRFAIDNVPTLVINGTYVTNVSMAGGPAQLLELVEYLAARENHR